MNETVINDLRFADAGRRRAARPSRPLNWGFIGYSLLTLAVVGGWLLRDYLPTTPNEGVGYWLGIVGGSLMLVLLFYPSIKRSRWLQRMGLTRHWFRIHIIFGLVGPLLILYHSNFRVEAINSKISLYSMLAVAISGLVGRYIYARIHRGLSGKRTHIEDLRLEIEDAVKNSRGIAAILPGVVGEMHAVSAELLGDRYTKKVGVGRSLLWTVKHHYVRIKLNLHMRRELKLVAKRSEAVRSQSRILRKVAAQHIRKHVRLLRRIAQLSFYERLFSIWHLFHMPLFILMVISASVHVLAVHMF